MKSNLKSKEYLKWISQFPCAVCSIAVDILKMEPVCAQETIVPHHLPNDNNIRRSVDIGNCIPLGNKHHRMIHGNPAKERQLLETFKKLAKQYADKWYNK